MTYDWRAALLFLAMLVALTVIGRWLAFRVPALARMRELNREADAKKLARERVRKGVAASKRAGLLTNAFFYVAVLSFVLPQPRAATLWRHAVDVVVVLLVFDFFYYLTHRFLFHGRTLRRVHALHHEARTPTYIDALYVHWLETAIGLVLFLGSMLVAAASGAPLSAYSMAAATLLFTQLNTINHTFVNLPEFPFRWLSRITWIHAAHHVDMNHGNYATLTMLYDRLFGTYEEPMQRATP